MVDRGKSYEGVPPPAALAKGERRLALVIGNSDYRTALPLKNPCNDAKLFADQLRTVHPPFDVTVELDADCDAMDRAIERFEAQLHTCDVALLFFAGHGLQVNGINYLIPVNANIQREIDLQRQTVSLSHILESMRRARISTLVFLDACRENLFARSLAANLPDGARSRSLLSNGLAAVDAPGTFVAFATAPNQVAEDGTGKNSPFTAALVKHMKKPGISINDAMIDVCRDVRMATGNRQQPWVQYSLHEHFRFCELREVGTHKGEPLRATNDWQQVNKQDERATPEIGSHQYEIGEADIHHLRNSRAEQDGKRKAGTAEVSRSWLWLAGAIGALAVGALALNVVAISSRNAGDTPVGGSGSTTADTGTVDFAGEATDAELERDRKRMESVDRLGRKK
ncbi:caspase family protein [Bradyrhizobium japonicum]|uniref:caspase family protein n=1 Tax=Bradyrhizobium japonicum TaxID=375 RepID=UPI000694921D|nr:caspase family protein [Bradyrhizobium japonicum]